MALLKARAQLAGRCLAVACLAPVGLQVAYRLGGSGAWLVLVLALIPALAALVGAALGRRGAACDELAWFAALGGALVVPMVPMVLGVDGFDGPLVMASGALAWLAWQGRLTALTAAPRWGRRARVLFGVWAAWSVGSALRGFFAYQTDAGVWMGESIWAVAAEPYGFRSLVDPGRSLGQLFLRLQMIGFSWAGFELAMGALGRGEGARFESRVARVFGWSLGLGLLVSLAEFSVASIWRGDASIWARATAGLGRNHRPLLDHNALGSMLVMLLPVTLVAAAIRRRTGGWMWLASAIGMAMLVLSRSKSALVGFGIVLPLAALFYGFSRGGKLRSWSLWSSGLCAAVLVVCNLVPRTWTAPLANSRYGHDLVRVVRLDAATEFLAENRSTVWSSAQAVAGEHVIVGSGLGRLPLLMGEHHDPAAEGWFNPRHENAHSQYLQWLAEEGLLGLGLGLAFLVAAVLGGLRRQSSLSLGAAAGFCGLALNLVVGHGLLVSSVALVAGGLGGWLIAGGSMTRVPDEAAGAALRRRPLKFVCLGLAFACAFVPLVLPGGRRALPLEELALGTFPWDFMRGRTPDRARSIGPDARWFETWGAGDVMKIPVRDIRDPRFKAIFLLDVAVNGQRVIEAWPLPHHSLDATGQQPPEVNPLGFLRIERPEGVVAGDLVEIHITSDDFFVGSRMFNKDHRRVSARVWPAFFAR